jgi:hypothetical protein
MANQQYLYEFVDFFELVIGSSTITIDEPLGWDKVQIKGSRDKDYHGFNYEFVDEKTTLTFPEHTEGLLDTGFDSISAVYAAEGGDGRITLRYGYTKGNQAFFEFEGTLNLNTYNISQDGIECSVEKVAFKSKLRTRSETKVNFSSTRDYDGNTITVPTPLEIKLHSKNIVKQTIAETVPAADFDSEQNGPNFLHSGLAIQQDTTVQTRTELAEVFAMPFAATKVDGNHPIAEKRFQFSPEEDGYCFFRWKAVYDMVATEGTGSVDGLRYIRKIEVHRNGAMIMEQTYQNTYVQNNFNGETMAYFDLNFDDRFEGSLLKGDEVYFLQYVLCEPIGTTTWVIGSLYFADHPQGGTFTQPTKRYTGSIEVNQKTRAAASNVFGYKILDALNHAVYAITGEANSVVSNFFAAGGCGEHYILTNGFQIRNFDILNKPFHISLDDLLKGIMAQWCVIVQFSRSSTGKEIIRIEPIEAAAGKAQILILDRFKIWDYEEEHGKAFTYNEVEIGYTKFAEDDINSLDEFNTFAQWLTSIETYKGKYIYKSPFVTSGYTIERVRREQFKKSPSSSMNEDDNIFCIAYVDRSIYRNKRYTIDNSVLYIHWQDDVGMVEGDQFKLLSGANASTVFTVAQVYAPFQFGNAFRYSYRITPAPVNELTVSFADLEMVITKPQAERNEPFALITGLVSPETAYNLRLSPAHTIYNHSPIISIGLDKKAPTKLIRSTFVKNNGDLVTQFDSTATCTLGVGTLYLREKNDITLSAFNTNNRLFLPIYCKFKAQLGYGDLVLLKESLTAQAANVGDWYGVLVFPDKAGILWEGFVWDFDYNPSSQVCEFMVYKIRLA